MAANRAQSDDAGYEFTVLDPPQPAPGLTFATRAGEAKTLADFRGRVVLVNLWATWCEPCVEEMPSLDRLQAKLGGRLTVLAISEDRRGNDVVEKLGLKYLGVYLDPKNAALRDFKVEGLPTSVLIGRDGRMRFVVVGAAEWDSPAMLARLAPYLAPEPEKPQRASAAE